MEDIESLINSTKRTFPESAEKATKMMEERGFNEEDKAYYIWLEAFSDITNSLLKSQNHEEAKSHLSFMSRMLSQANEEITNAIDTGYVESLMHKFTEKEKRKSWKIFPENIRSLYQQMWGKNF